MPCFPPSLDQTPAIRCVQMPQQAAAMMFCFLTGKVAAIAVQQRLSTFAGCFVADARGALVVEKAAKVSTPGCCQGSLTSRRCGYPLAIQTN